MCVTSQANQQLSQVRCARNDVPTTLKGISKQSTPEFILLKLTHGPKLLAKQLDLNVAE